MEQVIWVPAKTKALFGSKQVERLEVDKSRKLGAGLQGTVFLGRLKLQGERTRQVAVKYFNSPTEEEIHAALERIGGSRFLPTDHALRGVRLRQMASLIDSFEKAGVRMPKMGILEHEGENVQVSEIFARQGRSKLKELSKVAEPDEYLRNKPKLALEVAKQLGLMAKAGWQPRKISDVFHIRGTTKEDAIIVAEIDPFHYKRMHFPSHAKFNRGALCAADELITAFNGHEVRQQIIDTIIEHAGPRFQTFLTRRFSRLESSTPTKNL